jgi:hypothetical protein
MSAASVSWPTVDDDRVGALDHLGQLLDRIRAGQKPKPPEAPCHDATCPAPIIF